MSMSVVQFARDCGVRFKRCDRSWGGTVAYVEKDKPNITFAGFTSRKEAAKSWMEDTFGPTAAQVVAQLLEAR